MWSDVHFWLGAVTLLVVASLTIEFVVGNRSLRNLKQVPASASVEPPSVSIIIAARNEAGKLEHALRSVLALDHPNLEIIAVDDRSTDDTGAILDRLAGETGRLRVVHVSELPSGWLGKNHALQVGAEASRGELLLFTDADVVMEPSTVGRAVRFLLDRKLDHLALAPRLTLPGTLLNMVAGMFVVCFGIYAKPWKARDPKSSRFVGIGAFNLVRADVYRAVGGHRAIALRPDDDMKLGKLIKKSGHRQEVVFGGDFVTVEWYSSLGELVRGLEKNAFSGVDYNLPLVAAATGAQFLVFLWPVLALFVTGGWGLWFNVLVVLLLIVLYVDNSRAHGLKAWHVVGMPLSVLIFQYVVWRATLKTIRRGGIIWRDTHYPLAELKANKV